MATVAPASVVPSGRPEADAVPFARLCPNKETIEPGDSGALGWKLAPLTAAASTGAMDGLPRLPVTCAVPVRLRAGSVAVTVTVTAAGLLPDCQVLCQVPFWME